MPEDARVRPAAACYNPVNPCNTSRPLYPRDQIMRENHLNFKDAKVTIFTEKGNSVSGDSDPVKLRG